MKNERNDPMRRNSRMKKIRERGNAREGNNEKSRKGASGKIKGWDDFEKKWENKSKKRPNKKERPRSCRNQRLMRWRSENMTELVKKGRNKRIRKQSVNRKFAITTTTTCLFCKNLHFKKEDFPKMKTENKPPLVVRQSTKS